MFDFIKNLFLTKKPNWIDAPVWAKYLGVSSTTNGEWTWYETNPLPSPNLNYLWCLCNKQSSGIKCKTNDIMSTIESRPRDKV